MAVTNSNPRHTALPGYDVDYGSKEARFALAVSDAGTTGSGAEVVPGDAQPSNTMDGVETGVAEIETTSTPTELNVTTVGASAVQILPAEPGLTRIRIELQNKGLHPMYVRFHPTLDASLADGYLIYPGDLFVSQIRALINLKISVFSLVNGEIIYGFVYV